MAADEKNIPDRFLELPLENEFDFLMEEGESLIVSGTDAIFFQKTLYSL